MDRIARLLHRSDRSSRILEVGPSYNPVAPKSAGWNTHVVDHFPRDKLREKYAEAGVDVGVIEDVDTLWQDGSLHDSVASDLHGHFDTLIASHFIEHTPDLIGFLKSAEKLLRPDGVIALAIPDRRFCFDYFRSATMTGDLLEAHAAGRTRHTQRTAWNHMAYSATMDGALGWSPGPTARPSLMDPFAAAADVNARFSDEAPYADYHAWQFSPAGFALAMLELGQVGAIDWRVERMDRPDAFEFFVFLQRGTTSFRDAKALQAVRLALLMDNLEDTRRQIEFAVAGGGLAASSPLQDAGAAAMEGEQNLAEIIATLHRHTDKLTEIGEVAAWVRRLLRPARETWRRIREPSNR